jgi:hypothetical protein
MTTQLLNKIMTTQPQSYDLFFRFIETYAPVGYKGIDPQDPIIQELEKMMEINNQFFLVADVIQMRYHHVSKRSASMMGVEPEVLTPHHFFEGTHPDDLNRHSLGRATLIKLAHDLYVAEKGFKVLSTNLRIRNAIGNYSILLLQLYVFYSTIPYKSVFTIKVHTDIGWCKKINHCHHYYVGNDLSGFRTPDEELLKIGIPYSDREFEIIKLIESGMNSDQIADKIFLSVHTVNTHRRNILNKSGKETMSELIYDLMEQGVI